MLVVDDDPKAVELIALRMLGLASTVLRAYGGREAIEIARRELPDLIVLDLMMPEVNGFDVVEALQRAIPRRPASRSWSSPPSRSPPRTARSSTATSSTIIGEGRVRPRALHRRGPARHVGPRARSA